MQAYVFEEKSSDLSTFCLFNEIYVINLVSLLYFSTFCFVKQWQLYNFGIFYIVDIK